MLGTIVLGTIVLRTVNEQTEAEVGSKDLESVFLLWFSVTT